MDGLYHQEHMLRPPKRQRLPAVDPVKYLMYISIVCDLYIDKP